MALFKQQVSNLRKELRENRTVNNAVTLSAEKRSAKIAKLQQYLRRCSQDFATEGT